MRKPWQTKKWREKRAEFIKNKCCSWCGSKKYLTIDHLKSPNSQTEEDYYAFKDVIILCRRCAFARLKGMVLCKSCRKKYHRRRYPVCWSCLPRETRMEIERWKKGKKKRVRLPCGFSLLVDVDDLELGGIPEICIDHCPNDEIQGNINNCAHLLMRLT